MELTKQNVTVLSAMLARKLSKAAEKYGSLVKPLSKDEYYGFLTEAETRDVIEKYLKKLIKK